MKRTDEDNRLAFSVPDLATIEIGVNIWGTEEITLEELYLYFKERLSEEWDEEDG